MHIPSEKIGQWAILLTVIYAIVVVYGSLVPLAYTPVPLGEAIARFSDIRFLDLSLKQRADWIANGVLYFPLGLFAAMAIDPRKRSRSVAAVVLASLLGCVLATVVEFTQIQFPPRVVSINDLIAEFCGTTLGAITSFVFKRRFFDFVGSFATTVSLAAFLISITFVFGYIFASLFPFDFLVTIDELRWKFSARPPTWFAGVFSCGGDLHCLFKLPVEFFISIPVGIILASGILHRTKNDQASSYLVPIIILSIGIQFIQLFTHSGQPAVISVVVRAAGFMLGLHAYSHRAIYWRYLLKNLPLLALPVSLVYFVLLIIVHGFHHFDFQGVSTVFAKLESSRYLPFYLHYRSSEQEALRSLLSVFAMYLPVGLFFGLLEARKGYSKDLTTRCLFSTLMIILLVTAGRVFFSPLRMDVTNFFVGLVSAYCGLQILRLISMLIAGENIPTINNFMRGKWTLRTALERFIGISLIAFVSILLMPASELIVFKLILLLCVIVVFLRPELWPIILLASLPVLDWSTTSGWRVLEEYDLLMLTLIGVLIFKGRYSTSLQMPRAIALVLAVSAASMLVGLNFLGNTSGDSLLVQLTSLNAIKATKALFFTLLVWPFLSFELTHYKQQVLRRWNLGLITGLIFTGVFVFFEYASIAPFYDFSVIYRAVAGFKTMRLGGQEIDGYLLFAFPACLLMLTRNADNLTRLLAGLAFTFGGYAVIMTNTRWTYIAIFFLTLVTIFRLRFSNASSRRASVANKASAFVIFALVAVFALLQLNDTYIKERFYDLPEAVTTRTEHWTTNIAGSCDTIFHCFFGRGAGSYPYFNINASPPWQQPASPSIADHEKGKRLVILGGATIYIGQRLIQLPPEDLTLSFGAKTLGQNVDEDISIAFSICRHNTVNSYQCVGEDVSITSDDAHFQKASVTFNKEKIAQVISLPKHGISLAENIFFAIHVSQHSLILDNLSLNSRSTGELLRNGGFEDQPPAWFVISDNHLQWHAKNAFVHIFLEQGAVGVFAYIALLIAILKAVIKFNARKETNMIVLSMAIVGFLLAGLTGTFLDNAKLKFLFLSTAMLILAWSKIRPDTVS